MNLARARRVPMVDSGTGPCGPAAHELTNPSAWAHRAAEWLVEFYGRTSDVFRLAVLSLI